MCLTSIVCADSFLHAWPRSGAWVHSTSRVYAKAHACIKSKYLLYAWRFPNCTGEFFQAYDSIIEAVPILLKSLAIHVNSFMDITLSTPDLHSKQYLHRAITLVHKGGSQPVSIHFHPPADSVLKYSPTNHDFPSTSIAAAPAQTCCISPPHRPSLRILIPVAHVDGPTGMEHEMESIIRHM